MRHCVTYIRRKKTEISSKMLYNIPVFTRAAAKDTKLGITLDISHWCNVHESYLEDQAPAVQKALTHTRHLHARIGHTQSAQVNDPRAPEWKDTVQKFYSWWDKLLLLQSKKNKPFTITTEFGPFPYMPEAPYTRKALADQWELNVFMLKILQKRYKHI